MGIHLDFQAFLNQLLSELLEQATFLQLILAN
jgi:hypothetical protein